MKKKIILFGGSFDPIHNGHLKVAEVAYKELKADEVIFVLSKNPQYKEVSDTKNRLNMLNLAIEGKENFSISEYELECEGQYTYSINTVKHFLKVYPKENYELFFLIGFDEVNFLNKWHEIDELARLIQFVAVARPGYPKNHELIKKYNVKVVSLLNYNLSSTSIRGFLSFDMPKPVIDYLISHELYFVKTIKPYYTAQRYKHAVSVANLAYDIALANNKDPCIAYLAGYLHDIGKTSHNSELEHETNLKYGRYFKGQKVPATVMHQFTGALILEKYFHIQYKMIVEAVRYHTTGKKRMSWLAKIIYAADKLDPLRPYDSSDMIRRMKEDYKTGFVYVLAENKKVIEKMHPGEIQNNTLSLECFDYYLKRRKNMYNALSLVKKIANKFTLNKAEDIVIYDVKDYTPMARYYLVASAVNARQIAGFQEAAEQLIEAADGGVIKHISGRHGADWVVVDAGDILIHIFSQGERDRVLFDDIYKDCPKVDFLPKEAK